MNNATNYSAKIRNAVAAIAAMPAFTYEVFENDYGIVSVLVRNVPAGTDVKQLWWGICNIGGDDPASERIAKIWDPSWMPSVSHPDNTTVLFRGGY